MRRSGGEEDEGSGDISSPILNLSLHIINRMRRSSREEDEGSGDISSPMKTKHCALKFVPSKVRSLGPVALLSNVRIFVWCLDDERRCDASSSWGDNSESLHK